MSGPSRAMIGILMASAPALLAGCGPKAGKVAGSDGGPKPVMVTVADVEVRPVERAVDAVGTLKGWDEVTVGAKKVGRVARVRHDIGDRVAPGELLVEFETVDADLAIEQAEKQLLSQLAKVGVVLDKAPARVPTEKEIDVFKIPSVVQAQVVLDRAQQNLTRERSLMTKGAGMKQDLQNTENDVLNARAAFDNAVLNARSIVVGALATWVSIDVVKQARRDMEIRAPRPSQAPADLKAPLTYAVAKKSVSEGRMIREGDPVFDLIIDNPLKLSLSLPERYVSEVRVGQEVRIAVSPYPGRSFPGRVARINPMVDATNRTFEVVAAVPNDEGKLRPGGFAKAEIVVDHNARATIVPLDAVVRFAGVTKLFVVGDDGRAHSVAIETGKEGPGWVELLAPLPDRSRVITTGQSMLADGSPVVVRAPAAGGAGPDPSGASKTSPISDPGSRISGGGGQPGGPPRGE